MTDQQFVAITSFLYFLVNNFFLDLKNLHFLQKVFFWYIFTIFLHKHGCLGLRI